VIGFLTDGCRLDGVDGLMTVELDVPEIGHYRTLSIGLLVGR
jgi:hypothetical protein